MENNNYNNLQEDHEEEGIPTTIDEIFLQINEFGKFQKIFALYITYMTAATGMVSMSFMILGRKETPTCMINNNVTSSCNSNNYCDYQYEFPLKGTYSYSSSYNLYCKRSELFPLPTMSYFFGFAIGAWIGGTVSDKIGRKPVFLGSSICICICNIIMCLANDFGLFLTARFFIGFFIGSQLSGGWNLLMEVLGKNYRATIGGYVWCVWCFFVSSNQLIAYLIDTMYKEKDISYLDIIGTDMKLYSWQFSGLIMGLPMFIGLLFGPYL